MIARILLLASLCLWCSCSAPGVLTLNGFSQWRTGHDDKTEQIIPTGANALSRIGDSTFVYVKFRVQQYGEVSFPINRETPEGTEALRVDLSQSRFVQLTYRANQELILQLRQTGVHGGVQNHVVLPASPRDTTLVIAFSEFKGGKTPIDLADVSKFNFAFLKNNPAAGFAELRVSEILIDQYQP